MTANKSTLLTALLMLFISLGLGAQDEDPVLFTVDGNDVHVSEFRYIYEKNNAADADYSRESLEEYYGLYRNFKLKVARAKELEMDERQDLRKELAGYRRQLADQYLVDRKVMDDLVQEAYQRSQKDREVAHILIRQPANQLDEAGKELALRRAKEVYQRLKNGETWDAMVEQYTEDDNSKAMTGYLGWFTSMMPAGFYELETAIYDTPIGSVSEPVSSNLGYHIVKVLQARPARGSVEAAHILIKNQKDNRAVKLLADSIYAQLQSGADFGSLAKQYSADKNSARNGGRIGFVQINQYESSFEDAVFALENDGDYSKPVKTTAGFHIIQRLSRRDISDFARAERRFKSQMTRDPRVQIAKAAMIEDIKANSGYKEHLPVISAYKVSLKDDFLSYEWKAPDMKKKKVLSFNRGFKYTTEDLSKYLKSNIRDRIRLRDRVTPQEAFDELWKKFSDEMVAKYEEANLEEKYPDFKNLMREYSEGILLFEVTKENVWDKASQDTVGLKNYFRQNREKYQWGPRARLHLISVNTAEAKTAKKIKKLVSKKSLEDVVSKYNKDSELITYRKKILEKEDLPEGLSYERNAVSELLMTEDKKGHEFWKVDALLPSAPKSLNDSRGFVIADYQTVLEEEWIAELKSRYEVVRDEKVFESLIK